MPVIDLVALRQIDSSQTPDDPFEHQRKAILALREAFDLPTGTGRSGLLVLPTGAGKTFTAVKFLGDEALPHNIKILWLAQSFHLLDQAKDAFHTYAKWVRSRDTLGVRVVSSHPSHEKASDIEPTDDVVIMTTQTAIRNLHTTAEDERGQRIRTAFRHFLGSCNASGLIVVLDEAHHAPAFGCRTLLIGDEEPRIGIRHLVPRACLLGLTATPTYTDKSRSGWLRRIFGDEPVYRADTASLIAESILARPNFIPMPTGREYTVPDAEYNRIVRDHTDLPESIIHDLATDAIRNDFIVSEYVKNRSQYGKTIIFADRWWQCRYMMNKLREHGVNADVVYHHIDKDPGSIEARNEQTETRNSRVIDEFKNGKETTGRDTIEVLVNVRMLTEGTDVPSVKTVFITRQTTSSILMTQMIGRALRGKRVKGHDEANIVLFIDEWTRLIDWAPEMPKGDIGGGSVTKGFRPLEYISEHLIDQVCQDIDLAPSFADMPFLTLLPVGWYQTESIVSTSEDNYDETKNVIEYVMVFEHVKPKFEAFISSVQGHLSNEWANEYLAPEWVLPHVTTWIAKHFDRDADDIGKTLDLDVTRLVRHIAQNGTAPTFHAFSERNSYDLDALARHLITNNPLECEPLLEREFHKEGSLWKTFYRGYGYFRRAFSLAIERIIRGETGRGKRTSGALPLKSQDAKRKRHLSEDERKQLFRRDDYTCQSCGTKGRGVRLQPDHVFPFEFGGETSLENAQTLCKECNERKGNNHIDFRRNITPLETPRDLRLPTACRCEDVTHTMSRLVNFFYRCRAVCHLGIHLKRTGRHYSQWHIELFAGNNPEWLLQHKLDLIEFIHTTLNFPHVVDIEVTAPDWQRPEGELGATMVDADAPPKPFQRKGTTHLDEESACGEDQIVIMPTSLDELDFGTFDAAAGWEEPVEEGVDDEESQ